jgi:thioredoxin-related protein
MNKVTASKLLVTVLGFTFLATAARGVEWATDYNLALATAKASNKYVLLDFTGSDWCAYCIQIKKVVFSSHAFVTYARQNLVLVELDFPQRKVLPDKVKKQNALLASRYKVEGYPTVVLLAPNGKVLGQLDGYEGQKPAEVIAWMQKLKKKRAG